MLIRLRRRKYLIITICITFCLFLFHSLPEYPALPEDLVSTELVNIPSPGDHDEAGCPRVPISFSGMTGRLGNMISTYVNFIALQWKLGYKYHLPQHTYSSAEGWLTKPYLQGMFRNVTFPIANWSNWTKPRDAGPTGSCLYYCGCGCND